MKETEGVKKSSVKSRGEIIERKTEVFAFAMFITKDINSTFKRDMPDNVGKKYKKISSTT
jgi:hypothetical protein